MKRDAIDPGAARHAGAVALPGPAAVVPLRRTRAQILAAINAAAIEVFAREGLGGASTQMIAKQAGLSKQRLHYYISSKEDLYRQVLQDVVADWIKVFGFPDEAQGPREVLGTYVRRKLQFSFEQPLRSRIFAIEVIRGAPVLRPMLDTGKRRTLQAVLVIESWIERGLMDPLDPLLLLFNIWALTQFYSEHAEQVEFFSDRSVADPVAREEIIAQTIQFVLRGAGVR